MSSPEGVVQNKENTHQQNADGNTHGQPEGLAVRVSGLHSFQMSGAGVAYRLRATLLQTPHFAFAASHYDGRLRRSSQRTIQTLQFTNSADQTLDSVARFCKRVNNSGLEPVINFASVVERDLPA
jgi:hypothetical protein